jgi:hypothetical protein
MDLSLGLSFCGVWARLSGLASRSGLSRPVGCWEESGVFATIGALNFSHNYQISEELSRKGGDCSIFSKRTIRAKLPLQMLLS